MSGYQNFNNETTLTYHDAFGKSMSKSTALIIFSGVLFACIVCVFSIVMYQRSLPPKYKDRSSLVSILPPYKPHPPEYIETDIGNPIPSAIYRNIIDCQKEDILSDMETGINLADSSSIKDGSSIISFGTSIQEPESALTRTNSLNQI
ncbi:hypothetical protein HDV06_003923 [Boothiomyces sp. JEL0866]|nr:hypothetical protein HDV06_003923 [Boothiomyces sp. JEL0866]